ncbi:MAG: YitT family protein [Bilifractor sp.]|jgi:uncharacterized membrane-anchored protein YitT (DUF2179 family)
MREGKRDQKKNMIRVLAGTVLMAVSTNLFFAPADLVPGGFTGLAILIRRWTEQLPFGGIPVWLGNAILNVPLLLFSVRIRGWKFIRRTLIASVLFSLWLFLIPEHTLVDNLYLNSVIGGGIMGIGIGSVFLGKATTGGTDTLAALLQHYYPHIPTAKILPVMDMVIIVLSVWVFGMERSMFAVVSVIISGIVSNRVISGARNAYLAYVISDKSSEIAPVMMKELDRGVTQIRGTGLYTNTEKPVLFCAISDRQVPLLKEIVEEYDRNAFLIITEATEIRGEGFLHYSHEEL